MNKQPHNKLNQLRRFVFLLDVYFGNTCGTFERLSKKILLRLQTGMKPYSPYSLKPDSQDKRKR